DIAKLDIAYHAVLHQLRLADREDGATLIVAKRVIDLAIMGEREIARGMIGRLLPAAAEPVRATSSE
ncbi:MAG TPA: hypothetical protein VLA85_18680, partial [Verrucomicrobiae bacterium]|nr:hypothetical protein [Verrucomicrobiae bacterium]